MINLFSSVILTTIPLGNSQRMRLNLQVQSLVSIVIFFVHRKSIFFLPTFKEFGVNSTHKYASTTRRKSKTFAVQYLGEKSSKLSQKPLVRKIISLSFRFLFDHPNFPNIMSPGITVKTAVKTIAKQSECKPREI